MEKEKQSAEIYMKKYQTYHCPEGDFHMKFLCVLKATIFCIDFVAVDTELWNQSIFY